MASKSVKNSGLVLKRLSYGNGNSGEADWSAVDCDLIRRAIAAAARVGGALRFGYTRDGGAYGIGIYGDGDPYTIWIRPHEDIEEALRQITEAFEDMRLSRSTKQGKLSDGL